MTTPSLHKLPAPPRPLLRRRASLPRPETVAAARAAAVQNLLEPYLYDYAGFVDLVCDELHDPRSRPRILEFGCGTGRLTVPLLATRSDVEYHGFDRSPSRIAVAMERVARQGLERRAQFTAPFPLDPRAIGEVLQGHRVDFLLLPRFLQTVPLCGTEASSPHRVSFLAFCRQMVKPGGRIIVIEDVYGESAEEHARLSLASRGMFRAGLIANLDRVHRALSDADPALGARVGWLPGDPALLEDLFHRVQRPDAQILPLSTWQRMFDHLGFTYRTVSHPSQKALHLFTIRC
ncbi:MAG TPA: class I SAM-dependent methyltransferase [Gemmatimonadales bacterium]